MARWNGAAATPPELVVLLHGAAASLGVGIGLLKESAESPMNTPAADANKALEIFREVYADLRELSQATPAIVPPPGLVDLPRSLQREADLLAIHLDLEVIGDCSRLAPNHHSLIELASHEALINVRRHSGVATCRISLDASGCPFVLRVRDWGAGLQSRAQSGRGIALIRQLAESMGCHLGIGSQPGLGTELVLVGPPCARDRTPARSLRR